MNGAGSGSFKTWNAVQLRRLGRKIIVVLLRAEGKTWKQCGFELGITRSAARQLFDRATADAEEFTAAIALGNLPGNLGPSEEEPPNGAVHRAQRRALLKDAE